MDGPSMHHLIVNQDAIVAAAEPTGVEFYDLSLLHVASLIGSEEWLVDKPCAEMLRVKMDDGQFAFIPLVPDRGAFYQAVLFHVKRKQGVTLLPAWMGQALGRAGLKASVAAEDRIAKTDTLRTFEGPELARYRRYMRKVETTPGLEVTELTRELREEAVACVAAWYEGKRGDGEIGYYEVEHYFVVTHWAWLRSNFGQHVQSVALRLDGQITALATGSIVSARMWSRHMDRYDGRLQYANFVAFQRLAHLFEGALENDGIVGGAKGLLDVKNRVAPLSIPFYKAMLP